jgi:hypothetical protein
VSRVNWQKFEVGDEYPEPGVFRTLARVSALAQSGFMTVRIGPKGEIIRGDTAGAGSPGFSSSIGFLAVVAFLLAVTNPSLDDFKKYGEVRKT